MTEHSGGKTFFKYGCFGCLGLGLIVLVLVGGAFGLAVLKARTEQVENSVTTRDLPGRASDEGPEGDTKMPAGRGRIALDLAHAEFFVEPGPDETLRVEATYDSRVYELEETTIEGEEGADWSHEVTFRRSGSWLVTLLKEMVGGTRPEVRIVLPRDVPMDLDLRISEGGAVVELGGLWLREADVQLQKGGAQLSIARPLREPMERMSIRASMGGFQMTSLGNASPRELELECRMGGMDVDLEGSWSRDAEITVHSSMGGGALTLPRAVNIEGLVTGRVRRPVDPEVALPTLRFSASSHLGDLQISD